MSNKERLVTCWRCRARFDPTVQWGYGAYEGTSSNFEIWGLIPLGQCPWCRTDPVSGKDHTYRPVTAAFCM